MEDKKVLFEAGTEIYAEPDEDSDVIMTLEEETEFTVLKTDESGWIEVQVNEETIGYILPDEDSEEDGENEEVDEYTLAVSEGTNIRAEADGMSEIIYTFPEDSFVKLLEKDEDWYKVETKEGVIGFIFREDIEDDDEDDEDEKPVIDLSNKKVYIFTSRRAVMDLNEEIKLTSLLEGFEEGLEIEYQWECDKGNGFEPIEGANGDSYSYPATVESLSWSWRLVISF